MKISLKFHNYKCEEGKLFFVHNDMLTLAATGFQQTTSEDVPYFLFKEYFRVNRKPYIKKCFIIIWLAVTTIMCVLCNPSVL